MEVEKKNSLVIKNNGMFVEKKNRFIFNCGAKEFDNLAHFISNPKPTPRRKKCPRTNEEGLNC